MLCLLQRVQDIIDVVSKAVIVVINVKLLPCLSTQKRRLICAVESFGNYISYFSVHLIVYSDKKKKELWRIRFNLGLEF